MNQYELYKRESKRIREEWFNDHIPEFIICEDDFIKIKWRKPGTWNMAVVYYIDCKMGYLMVTGDLGEAIYQWSPPISIDFLGGCDLDYFDGKCEASSCGERGRVWSPEIAENYIRSYIEDHTIGEDKGDSFYDTLYHDGHVDNLVKEKDPGLALYLEEETYKGWSELSREEKDRFIVIAKEYLKNLSETLEWRKLREHDYRRELIEKQKKFAALGPDAIGACSHESEWHRFLNDNGYEFFGDEYYEYGDIGRVISIRVQSHLIGLKMIREGLASGKFSKPVKVVDRSIDLPVNIPEEKPWSFWNLFSWLKFWA